MKTINNSYRILFLLSVAIYLFASSCNSISSEVVFSKLSQNENDSLSQADSVNDLKLIKLYSTRNNLVIESASKVSDTAMNLESLNISSVDIGGNDLGQILREFLRTKGVTETEWWSLFNDCIKGTSLTRNDAHYFGLSTPYGIGSILTNNIKGEWNASKYLTEKEQALCFSDGGDGTCAQTETFKMDLQTFLNANIASGLNVELTADLKTTKDVTAKIGAWRLSMLDQGKFKAMLDTATTGDLKTVRDDIAHNNNFFIITSAAQITGFSTNIILSSDMSDSLNAKLSQGIVKNLNGGAKINFSSQDKRTIIVSSTSQFNVIMSYSRIHFTK